MSGRSDSQPGHRPDTGRKAYREPDEAPDERGWVIRYEACQCKGCQQYRQRGTAGMQTISPRLPVKPFPRNGMGRREQDERLAELREQAK